MLESSVPRPRRRPVDGGYARGVETRRRIMNAAFAVFAEDGYASASTRRIASEAGVRQPVLQYYFGSKEGLHRACGQLIVDEVMAQIKSVLTDAQAALSAPPQESGSALCSLIRAMVLATVATPHAAVWGRFMGRCEADRSGPAGEIVDAAIGEPLKQVATRLVARALDLDPGSNEAQVRTLLLMSQLVMLWLKRDTILGSLSHDDTETVSDLLVAVLVDHVRRLVSPATL